MTTEHKPLKFISSILIVVIMLSTVLLSRPQKVNAQEGAIGDVFDLGSLPVFDAGTHIDTIFNGITEKVDVVENTANLATNTVTTGVEVHNVALEILKELARTAAKILLQKMTVATVAWINSGFSGSPLYVQNPSSFFNDIAKTEVNSLVNLFGYDPTRFPFGAAFAQNLINSYQSQLATNSQYTLSKVINDPTLLNNFRNNFNVGGWNGFLINTQYPQNNYLGFQMIASQAAAQKLAGTVNNTAKTVATTLQQSAGFLSPKSCPSNPKYNANVINEFQPPVFTPSVSPPTTADISACYGNVGDKLAAGVTTDCINNLNSQYNSELASEKAAFNENNSCPGGLQTITPGAVVGNQITTALSSSFLKTEMAGAIGGSVSAILDALLNQVLKQGVGLIGLSTNKAAVDALTPPLSTPPAGPGTCSDPTSGNPLPSLTNYSDCVSLGGNWTSGATPPAATDVCTLVGGGTAITTQADCTNINGTWGTPPTQVYIFCTINGNTSQTTQNDCLLAGGTPSATAPMGTCLVPTTTTDPTTGTTTISGSTSSTTTQNDCLTQGGNWTVTPSSTTSSDQSGLGNCVVNAVTTSTTQAACTGQWTPAGTCSIAQDNTQAECALFGGTWNDGTTTTPPPPAPGKCSIAQDTTQSECTSFGGIWTVTPLGACNISGVSVDQSVQYTQQVCVGLGGNWTSANPSATPPPPAPTGICISQSTSTPQGTCVVNHGTFVNDTCEISGLTKNSCDAFNGTWFSGT